MATITKRSGTAELSYDTETGVFVGIGGHYKAGEAGYVDAAGYRRIRFGDTQYKAHRLAHYFVTGEHPTNHCDHINGDPLDNRWSNLRFVSNRENCLNAKRMKNNTSGVTGVSWYSKNNCWMVRINDVTGAKYLGSFSDFFEAVCARKSAEIGLGYHQNHDRSA